MIYSQEWALYFLRIAEAVSLKSHCIKRRVGAVLVVDKQIVATGYNGLPVGFQHCDEQSRCYAEGRVSGEKLHLLPCVHAEENAIHQAARWGMAIQGGALFISIAPCNNCLKSCISAGISAVFYEQDYALDKDGERLRRFYLENAQNFKLLKIKK